MQINKANLDAIYYQFSLVYKQGYEATPVYWNKYASLAPSGARENHYGWIGKIPRLRQWVGSRVLNNLQARGYVLVNLDYEDSIGIDRNDIEDDQIGVFTGYVEAIGQQSRLWPDDITTAALAAGTTALAFDGQPFFYNAHPVDMDNSGSTTYQNRFDSSANGGGVGYPCNAANYAAVRAAMMGIQGEDGRSLNVVGSLLIVPPQLEATGRQILLAETIAQAVGSNSSAQQTNVWKGTAELLVNAYLIDATRWYLLCTTRGIMPLVFQQRVAPEFTIMDRPTDPNVFFDRQFILGVRARGNAGYSLPFLAATGSV